MSEATTETIPDFSLAASTGQTLALESFRGKVPMAIVFLEGLGQDRDLVEALDERLADFGSERSQILAVAKVTAREARDFAQAEGISMPILADASGAIFRDYGAENDAGELRRLGVVATAEGRLVRRFDPLPVDGAAEGLLNCIRAEGSVALDGSAERRYTETPEEGY
jgi:peroxiredoxin